MGWKKSLGIAAGIGLAAFTGGASLALSAGLGVGGAALLGGDDSTAKALQQQNELMLRDQQNRLNAMLQQNLLDASNANSNLTSVVTGDTLTVAENIKKRKKITDSVSSSLGL